MRVRWKHALGVKCLRGRRCVASNDESLRALWLTGVLVHCVDEEAASHAKLPNALLALEEDLRRSLRPPRVNKRLFLLH